MSEANLTSIKGKDWIFNALWAASGEAKAPKCLINVPITFLFREGVPIKALSTSSETGLVNRVNIDAVDVERSLGEAGFRGDSNRALRIMRMLLLDYSLKNDYERLQRIEEPFVSTVRLYIIWIAISPPFFVLILTYFFERDII